MVFAPLAAWPLKPGTDSTKIEIKKGAVKPGAPGLAATGARQPLQNAVPFAVDMAFQTWAPQLKSGVDYLRDQANKINQFNISSCEAAQTLTAGIAGSFQQNSSDSFICKTYAQHSNSASSWLKEKQGCNDPKTAKAHNAAAKNTDGLADMVKQNRNLVWYLLLKNAFLKSNLQIAAYLMAMTGTLITQTNSEGHSVSTAYEPLMVDEKTFGLEVMLYGAPTSQEAQPVKIWRCDDSQDQEACLVLKEDQLKLDASKALVPQIQKDLESIAEKMLADQKLTDAQQNMINAINFPMLHLIEHQINAGWIPEYHLYADILARIILSHYLNQLIGEAKNVLAQPNLANDPAIQRLIQHINQAQIQVVNKIESKAYDKLKQQSQLLMHSLEIEKLVVGEMSAQAESHYYFGHTQ